MSFDCESFNQRSQITLHVVQTKPIIKFSYGQPPLPLQNQNQLIPSQIPTINIVSPNWQPKRIIEHKMSAFLQGNFYKKRIFNQNYSQGRNPMGKREKSLKTTLQRMKKEISRSDIPKTGQTKKRRRIFSSQERKQVILFETPPNHREQKCASLFVFPQRNHPNSVVNYVDISSLKDHKTKISHEEIVPLKNNIQHHHHSHFQPQKFQQCSPVKLEVSLLSDKKNDQSLDTSIVDPFFLSSERFFDKETNSPQKKKISYNDVSIYATLVNQIKHTDSGKNTKQSTSYFTKSITDLCHKVTGYKYFFPSILILFGMLLLIIQISK